MSGLFLTAAFIAMAADGLTAAGKLISQYSAADNVSPSRQVAVSHL
jgi:hypothetical protein